jgi:isopropylmalate/homocitrate/citramalate synthase
MVPGMSGASERVMIQDVTLREGQQAAEVAFTPEEKVDLGARLAATGVRRVQAGYAGEDDETIAALKRAVPELELSALLVAFRPGWEAAAMSAAAAGVDVLMVLFRVAPGQLRAIGFSPDQALDAIGRAVELSLHVAPAASLDPSFVTLTDDKFLRRVYEAGAQAGARHFGVADSTGIACPERIAGLVGLVKEVTGGEVGVHCHDDFGLGLANTLAGISAGATLADASLLGLGERAGNCATEELAVALELLYGVPTGIRLERLTPLAEHVSAVTGCSIPTAKAVVGADAFSQKLDMHVALTREDPTLLEPFPPERVGNRRRLRLGLGTGPVAVAAKLEQLGLPAVDADRARQLAESINEIARRQKSAVSEEAFRALIGGQTSTVRLAAETTRSTEGK